MADKKQGNERTPHQNRWGKMPIDPQVKNPHLWHTSELQSNGKALPPHMSRDSTDETYSETSMDKNIAHARRSNRHEAGADAKMAAYMPRPGDNMPKPFQNHSGQKKPSLVLRFTQKSGGRFYWKDWMNTQREIWVLPRPYGFKAVFSFQGEDIAFGYGKTALESVQSLLGNVKYYSVDAACNLPLWTMKKKVVERKAYIEPNSDVYLSIKQTVYQVPVFKTVHILLGHHPRIPLPTLYVEHLNVEHMHGGFGWEYTGREITDTPIPSIQDMKPLEANWRDSDEFTSGGIDE